MGQFSYVAVISDYLSWKRVRLRLVKRMVVISSLMLMCLKIGQHKHCVNIWVSYQGFGRVVQAASELRSDCRWVRYLCICARPETMQHSTIEGRDPHSVEIRDVARADEADTERGGTGCCGGQRAQLGAPAAAAALAARLGACASSVGTGAGAGA